MVRTLTEATDELSGLNPPGRRQLFATLTVKNDPETLKNCHAVYLEYISTFRRCKGLVWTLVLQLLLREWARKGDANPLGLDEDTDEPLVTVSFAINWDGEKDDDLVRNLAREAIEKMEEVAKVNGTGHRYRFMNHCATWQKTFEGYGEKNKEFLKDVSRKYDPDGLFQTSCNGGFKLGREEN